MIGAVENGLIAELQGASQAGTLGYRYLTLETYPADWDAYLKEKGQLRTPGAWAVFEGLFDGEDNNDDATGADFEARFALVVAAQNLRNETATRHGGPDPQAEPGSYQLAEDAIRLISGSDLGLALVHPIEVTGLRPIAQLGELRTQKLSLMAIGIKCRIGLGHLEGAGNPVPFETFHADWDVPPFGNVELAEEAPFLPAASPDAEDLVELPQ